MDAQYVDRSDRGKLRLTGPQRAWFLHQVLTQAFEDMPPGDEREAAMITAHGRMIGYLEVYALENSFLLHYEKSLRATFPQQLERYVFATQVEIADVSEDMALIFLAGTDWAVAAGAAAPGKVTHPTRSLGIPAGYIWTEEGTQAGVMEALSAEGASQGTEEGMEAIRIAHGVPRWGYEMNEKTLPQEVGLDAWAVHYDKGCYVGQEAMAKIHFRGKVNRRLARLEGDGLRVGTEVISDEGKVGKVTSVADGRALALIRAAVEPGTVVRAGEATAEVVA